MTTSETASTSMITELHELQTLFEMMREAQVAIVELPGGFKVVMHPDVPQPVEQDHVPSAQPRAVHEDPFLYADGNVPSFG